MPVLDTAELVLRANRYSGSGDWLDESGNGHHATLVNNPTWDGEKFTLDGATQYFTVPHDASLNPDLGSFTAVMVVAPTNKSNQRFLEKRSTDIYRLYQNPSNFSPVININGTIVANPLFDGTQQTLGFRVDRSLQELRCYIDGSGGVIDISGVGAVSPTSDLFVGAAIDGSFSLAGDIYGVALFRAALTDQEIEQAGQELIAAPAGPSNRMGGVGAIRRKGGPRT